MNKTITLVALFMSSSAFAGYINIPQDQLESYKKATLIAGQKNPPSNCSASGGPLASQNLGDYVQKADSGKINFDGKQPILVFESSSIEGRANTKANATIISSADYKSVVSIQVEELQLSDVNVGDLRKPHTVKSYVVTASAKCD